MTTILYFATVREAVGVGEERLDLPVEVVTVAQLVDHLSRRTSGHAAAFADTARLRVAVDHVMADFSATIVDANEIAFFPPVTGG